jgi:hypothetical protein
MALGQFSSTEAGIVPASGGGSTAFIRADGTWAVPAGGGGSLALTTVEVDLGTVPRNSGNFIITTSGLTSGKPVIIGVAAIAFTGKGTATDESEMDGLTVTGQTTSTTTIQCYWTSATSVLGNFKFNYVVSA